MKHVVIVDYQDTKVKKYQPCESLEEATIHIGTVIGSYPNAFVAPDPGGSLEFWTVDGDAQTVKYNEADETISLKNKAFNNLRSERNRLLRDTDWWASSDLSITQIQKDYRQSLRDLPANTSDPFNVTWPTAPS